MAAEWTKGFLAMSAIVGLPLEEALAAIDGAEDVEAKALVRLLRSSPREARARAIASALVEVVAALPEWEIG